jgi:hypothetical protein
MPPARTVRNLFDQYSQPENRLTHALAVCLDEDRDLLRRFLAWIGVRPRVSAADLLITEQALPGDPPEVEDEAERKGLPDIVIHDGDVWCLLIESKIQARLTDDQLMRHERTLRRRGFGQVDRLVLTKSVVRPAKAIAATWSVLYEWLGTEPARSQWPARLRAYLRAAEVRLAREEYLTEGTLTMFDGFQFSDDNPYTYGEGKRLLKLAMSELRKNRDLKRLGMDPSANGRGAITGRGGTAVWDFLALTDRPKTALFTGWPHLTLAVHADHLEVAVTIPNGVEPAVRRRLARLGSDGLARMNRRILARGRKLVKRGAWIQARALQRHYPTQRSHGIVDAHLVFKLDTSSGAGPVKRQFEWTELFSQLLQTKRANIQFQYMVIFPWDLRGLDTRHSLELMVGGWTALKPLLDVARGRAT